MAGIAGVRGQAVKREGARGFMKANDEIAAASYLLYGVGE